MDYAPLNRLLHRLEKLHPKFIDLSLERLLKLLNKLSNPHLKLSRNQNNSNDLNRTFFPKR